MKLIKTIKPVVFQAKTKQAVLELMTRGKNIKISYADGHNFSGWADNFHKYGMNFEKRRKKSVEIIDRRGKKTKRVIQKTFWIGRLYKFRKDFPITIKQNCRNFDFTY